MQNKYQHREKRGSSRCSHHSVIELKYIKISFCRLDLADSKGLMRKFWVSLLL